jgi:hypothetical protein
MRSHLTASLLATGALLFLPLQAFAQAEYDDAVGRPVELLLSKYGTPTTIHEVGSTHKTYQYVGDGCTFFFTVHANRLVLDGKSVGSNCRKGYPDMESKDIASVPGWSRYDGPTSMRIIAARAAFRLLTENYDGVDQLFVQLNNPNLLLNDGRRMVTGLSNVPWEARSMMSSDMLRERLAAWHARNPQSPAAAMIESMYWQMLAWEARGGGSAASVSREGWELFHERIAKAEEALLRVPDAKAHPVWYTEYLRIAHHAGWPKERLLALFGEAKLAHPGYHPYYFQVIAALTPRWGGSIRLIDSFIAAETIDLAQDEANELYARMYWSLQQAEGTDFDVFRHSGASWARMKQGFARLREKNPSSFWTANNYAAFACRAHDKDAYQAVRPLMGYVISSAWPSNLSLEICDRRLLGSA